MEASFNLHVPSGAQQTVFFLATPLASAATPDIGAISGDYVHITGTTTITGFVASYPGRVITVVFDAALTLTDSASLILPGGANILTAADDVAMFRYEDTPVAAWRCVFYERASGASLTGIPGFLSGLNTAAPNATVNVAYLLATGGSANKDVSIIPTGTGGFMLAVPDSTATGGNKRGIYAVDLQLYRAAAAQVASGSYTFAAGLGNTVDGNYATIPGGFENSTAVSSTASVISGGYQNSITGEYEVIGGGRSNLISSGATAHNVISGGYDNTITSGAGYSAIWGGSSLTLSATDGTAGFLSGIASGGGSAMTITANNTIVFGNNNLWLANNNNTASQLRFYEPYNTSGAFPNTANYTAFQAQAQAADVTYTLPAAAPTVNGQALTATTAGVMSWATVSGGMAYSEVTGTSQAMAVAISYGMNNAALVTGTLPASAAVGDEIEVCGIGAGGWAIAQNASQTIIFNATTASTAGVGGSVASTDRYDTIRLRCIVANTTFLVLWAKGTLTVT